MRKPTVSTVGMINLVGQDMPKQVKLRLWRTCKTKAYSFVIKPYKAMLRSLKQESHDFSRWECQKDGTEHYYKARGKHVL